MYRKDGMRRGRFRNKGRGRRTRDLSSDPLYKDRNFNKITKQHGLTPFRWNIRCNYANKIYSRLDAKLKLKTELSEL